jgi:hypothetical protein
MKLAECWARESAHRDEGRPRNEDCPRSGLVTHHLMRPTTMADIPELESGEHHLTHPSHAGVL